MERKELLPTFEPFFSSEGLDFEDSFNVRKSGNDTCYSTARRYTEVAIVAVSFILVGWLSAAVSKATTYSSLVTCIVVVVCYFFFSLRGFFISLDNRSKKNALIGQIWEIYMKLVKISRKLHAPNARNISKHNKMMALSLLEKFSMYLFRHLTLLDMRNCGLITTQEFSEKACQLLSGITSSKLFYFEKQSLHDEINRLLNLYAGCDNQKHTHKEVCYSNPSICISVYIFRIICYNLNEERDTHGVFLNDVDFKKSTRKRRLLESVVETLPHVVVVTILQLIDESDVQLEEDVHNLMHGVNNILHSFNSTFNEKRNMISVDTLHKFLLLTAHSVLYALGTHAHFDTSFFVIVTLVHLAFLYFNVMEYAVIAPHACQILIWTRQVVSYIRAININSNESVRNIGTYI